MYIFINNLPCPKKYYLYFLIYSFTYYPIIKWQDLISLDRIAKKWKISLFDRFVFNKNRLNAWKILQTLRKISGNAHAIQSFPVHVIFSIRTVQYFPSWGDNFTSTAFRTIGTNGTIDVKIWQAVRQVLASYTCKYAYREYAHNERRKEDESAEAFLESQAARYPL